MSALGPFLKRASSCQHISGERHRFAAFDANQLALDLGWTEDGGSIPVGGLRVGTFGIVLMGFVSTDVHAVLRNVLWEDEHCLGCCGGLLRFTELFRPLVLIRCGPTIEPHGVRKMYVGDDGRSITDEYWTD